ncbi:MAG: hypothetical protein AAF432_00230 [Planctomycetota bacterium]
MPRLGRQFIIIMTMLSLCSPPAFGVPWSVVAGTMSVTKHTQDVAVQRVRSLVVPKNDVVARQLRATGMMPDDVSATLAALTDADLAVLSRHPAMMQRAGSAAEWQISRRLVALGMSSHDALVMVQQLTPADCAVLFKHPAMMQRAGDMTQTEKAFLIWGLIIAGFIVLGIVGNTSGFVSIS